MSTQKIARLVLVSSLLLLPGVAWAQTATSGSIAGVVRDTSGGVMPGVTVEAASPALIEKVRTVVSDGEGRYTIVDLRPGAYTVTFTLEGFNTFKREGIELTTGFTAAVNAEMRVGALSETVTVTGASPVVDVQNVRSQTVLTRTVLDALPTGKSIQGFAALTVGASLYTAGAVGNSTQDVGGNKGEKFGTILIHGSRGQDGRLLYDGTRFNNMLSTGGGQNRFWSVNMAAVQEVAIETSGMSAEAESGGVQQNSVPKDGGNIFSVYFSATGTNENLQASNLTDRLLARGLTTVGKVKRIYDVGVGVGGPIKRDKLWFYFAHRQWNSQEYVPGNFYNKTHGIYLGAPDSFVSAYTPDLSRRAYNNLPNKDNSLRLTWQATSKHKFVVFDSVQRNCECILGVDNALKSPEGSTDWWFTPNYLALATWTYPATNRLLFEAGVGRLYNILNGRVGSGATRNDITILELSRNYFYGAAFVNPGGSGATLVDETGNNLSQHNERFLVSYITGSHAFKAGIHNLGGGQLIEKSVVNQNLLYRFNFGVPVQLLQFAAPGHSDQKVHNVAVFAQDQWTVRNLTLNLGVRFDRVNGYVPAQDRPAGQFAPALHVDRIDNVPNFTDLNPRLGVAYDLFGNGKTAIKASLGRYLGSVGADIALNVNPANAMVVSSTRTWTDTNGNFKPDCDLYSFAANSECGALDNKNFGSVRVSRRYAPDVLDGFGLREYNWQTSVSVQHELTSGVSVNVGYFRTWFGNFTAIDNLKVTPADFDPYCITAPVDARLPGGGGYQICDGLADVKPTKFGLVDNLVTKASHYGRPREQYDGVDATFNARFGQGGLLQGGMNVGRTQSECVMPDGPLQFCKNVPPFLSQFKFAGVYPLPFWGLQASATFQNLPGIPLGTNSVPINFAATNTVRFPVDYVATNALIKPSLGRDLAQGPKGVALITLIEPNTEFEDRLNQFDVRLTKIVRVGRVRVRGMFDIYNIFNGDTILSEITRYGGSFLRPSAVLGARLLKLSAQLDF